MNIIVRPYRLAVACAGLIGAASFCQSAAVLTIYKYMKAKLNIVSKDFGTRSYVQ